MEEIILEKILENLDIIHKKNNIAISQQNELIWAEIFKSTIQGSEWLNTPVSLSPGRAAIGYNALYALYRVLNDIKPKRILEMGLGQSTKLIAKYMEYYGKKEEGYKHYIVEHNKEWETFFEKVFTFPDTTELVHLNAITSRITTDEVADTDILFYENFADRFKDEKFDMIFIDGPNGSEQYSRIDITDILPGCLNKSFVIFMDDAERIGESRTISLIHNILSDHNIKSFVGGVAGLKMTAMVVSEDLEFLCTI